MKRGAAVLLLLSLVGCGDTPAADAWRQVLIPPPPAPIALQGPALLIGEGAQMIVLIPVQQSGNRTLWRGEGNVALATDGARVVASAGFGQMLSALRTEGIDPMEDPRALAGRQATTRRIVDLQGADRDAGSMRFGIALNCVLQGSAPAAVLLVQERCTGGDLSFTNRFWIDTETNQPLRSEQWAGDAGVMLRLEWRGPQG